MDATSTAINLTPIILDILGLAGLVLVGVVTWAVNKYIGSHLDDKAKELLETAIKNGIAYAEKQGGAYLAAHPVTINGGNATVAVAANYVIQNTPDALTRLGVTQDQLSQKILARLPA